MFNSFKEFLSLLASDLFLLFLLSWTIVILVAAIRSKKRVGAIKILEAAFFFGAMIILFYYPKPAIGQSHAIAVLGNSYMGIVFNFIITIKEGKINTKGLKSLITSKRFNKMFVPINIVIMVILSVMANPFANFINDLNLYGAR